MGSYQWIPVAGILLPAVPIKESLVLVAAARQLGSGSVQLSDCQMLRELTPHQKANARGGNPSSKTSKPSNNTKRISNIILDDIPIQRTGSQSSLSSIESAESLVSAASTSSNMTAIGVATVRRNGKKLPNCARR